jgi:hypothetical protein
MAAPRNRPHLFIDSAPNVDPYRPHPRMVPPRDFPRPQDRRAHARALRKALKGAQSESEEARERAHVEIHGAEPGFYIQFESVPGVDLKLETLEDRRRGLELVAVRTLERNNQLVQQATAFVPEGSLSHFFGRFEQYAEEKTKSGEPRHKDFVDRIASLKRATLKALWTDVAGSFPKVSERVWWEVWLRRHDGHELDRITEFAEATGLKLSERRLVFDDRIVVLAFGSAEKLAQSLLVLNDIAELRGVKETAAFFVEQSPKEQADWANSLLERLQKPSDDAPSVCILDSGVNRQHPLLTGVLAINDATAVQASWGPQDDGGGSGVMGHGTGMAGLAAYGDLAQLLAGSDPIVMRHRLESVKILPPSGANKPELYGAITAQATARPEINAPDRLRVFSLAVTAAGSDNGQPTSWSAAVDALAAGRAFDAATHGLVYLEDRSEARQRLFVISAGNVDANLLNSEHLVRSDLEPIQDPAQAWNALAVGAITNLAEISDVKWNGWNPVSDSGELSPWSTTSVPFSESWPLKPEVVYEGGNVACDGVNFDFPVPELCLLSTHFKPTEKVFGMSYGTSASTSQVSRICARVLAEYPVMWPEAVRGLIVHSARWTAAMNKHFSAATGKRQRAKLVRRYGYGVPDEQRALHSANDSLTLIFQGEIRPYSSGRMREMHFHALPWPTEALESLGDAPVQLRVTLSYFIEPNPTRRGWKGRYRYPSHGLRFEVKGATESATEFKKRLNQAALSEDEEKPRTSDSSGWYLGEQARNRGSIHSDIWDGSAADLAARGMVGIYPVSGWWKDLPSRDRSEDGCRYALIVSIETETIGVDLWTPVANEIGIEVELYAG